MPRGVPAPGAAGWKAPAGYEPFNMTGLPAGSRAVVETTTGEIRVVNSIGQIVDVPSGPLPTWTSAADNGNIKIVWGGGIEAQGMPWEEYLATQLPSDARLPPSFKTFDFFDRETAVAVSAKTLDTMTASKISDPSQVYYALKGNVDSVANFSGAETLSGRTVNAAAITSRELQVAVPSGTTAAQWEQIDSAIQYGLSRGVIVKVTVVKP